jgi:hypothetical protein
MGNGTRNHPAHAAASKSAVADFDNFSNGGGMGQEKSPGFLPGFPFS